MKRILLLKTSASDWIFSFMIMKYEDSAQSKLGYERPTKMKYEYK